MSLPGTPVSAPNGLRGFDTNTILTDTTAAAFRAEGYTYCIRYLSRVAKQGSADLTAQEARAILKAGLALMTVQHVRLQDWDPTAELGASDGVHAAYHAMVIGFPPGVNIWCDLEGVRAGTPQQSVIDYCNEWADAVAAAGYIPGLYVGAASILDGHVLHDRLHFQHYWKSLSTVPDIAIRGYQMIQTSGVPVNGVGIDNNITLSDRQGGNVVWLAPTPVVVT